MAIILILVVLWAAVLTPGILRRVRGRESHESIDSFHHSLHLLERSGPKIVSPAYRLTGSDNVTSLVPPAAPTAPARPRLVLLRPVGQEGEEPMYDESDELFDDRGERYERVVYERDEPESFGATPAVESYGRRMAARRRRNILTGLALAVLITGLGGFVISFLWDLTILAILALVAYVGLMAWFATHEAPGAQRHVAHATAGERSDYDRYDEYDDYREYDDGYADRYDYTSGPRGVDPRNAPRSSRFSPRWDEADEGWWDQPRRSASR